jgi:hypothetical protein
VTNPNANSSNTPPTTISEVPGPTPNAGIKPGMPGVVVKLTDCESGVPVAFGSVGELPVGIGVAVFIGPDGFVGVAVEPGGTLVGVLVGPGRLVDVLVGEGPGVFVVVGVMAKRAIARPGCGLTNSPIPNSVKTNINNPNRMLFFMITSYHLFYCTISILTNDQADGYLGTAFISAQLPAYIYQNC